MSRPIGEPLRPLTTEEREELKAVARCPSQPLQRHQRATALLAVAEGASLTAAAGRVGWRVCRYTERDEARILREFRRPPDREGDGTATWSLGTLQRALRAAPDGLPEVSTYTPTMSSTARATPGSATAAGARPALSCASASRAW
jgi:hypothetical protein